MGIGCVNKDIWLLGKVDSNIINVKHQIDPDMGAKSRVKALNWVFKLRLGFVEEQNAVIEWNIMGEDDSWANKCPKGQFNILKVW